MENLKKFHEAVESLKEHFDRDEEKESLAIKEATSAILDYFIANKVKKDEAMTLIGSMFASFLKIAVKQDPYLEEKIKKYAEDTIKKPFKNKQAR